MRPKKVRPGTVLAGTTGALQIDFAGRQVETEYKAPLTIFQARRLQAVFGVSRVLAPTIAELAFISRRSA